MNTDNLLHLLQQSFRISVGATASFLETLQDPQKRSETLSELQTQLTHLVQEWAQKGEITEQEARRFVDEWLSQQRAKQSSTSTSNNGREQPSSSGSQDNVQAEIEELTEQVIALRTELENLRNSP